MEPNPKTTVYFFQSCLEIWLKIAGAVAPNLSDTLTLFQPGGSDSAPQSQRLHQKFPRGYISKSETSTLKIRNILQRGYETHCGRDLTQDDGRSIWHTDYGRPMKPFLSNISNFWAWTDKLGKNIFEHLGYFRHPFWH